MKYVIKLVGLYNTNDYNAYYRKQGKYCFDFVNSVQFASEFDSLYDETIESVMTYADQYLKMYNAKGLDVVQLDENGSEIFCPICYHPCVPV